MKMLWIDTETTGTDPEKNAIVQISGIVDVDGKPQEEFDYRVRPHEGAQISQEALDIIGKTKDEIRAFPPAYEAYAKIKTVIERYVPKFTKDVNKRFKIAGQNIGFDYGMMEAFFRRCGDPYWYASVDRRGIDIIQATALFKFAGVLEIKDFKLGTVCNALGIPLSAHDSMNDIRASREVYQKYIEIIRQTKKELV